MHRRRLDGVHRDAGLCICPAGVRADAASPQLVRYDGRTREVITSLLRREHQPSTPELRPLARRAG